MSVSVSPFRENFQVLTGHKPYPWQERLYSDWLLQGKTPPGLGLPTGTGKTHLMALWLLALARGARLPRRLIWVVDRRAVVDQATREAEKLRRALGSANLHDVTTGLLNLSISDQDPRMPLAISTLRGEYEDNREWSKDPSRPAIVVGTVDMVGSRLLFSGYGDGPWRRPFHAALLAVDALIVLDEAQLSTPFEALLREVERTQKESTTPLPGVRFLPISATLRSGTTFGLLPEEREGGGPLPKILEAPKTLVWHGSLESPVSPDTFIHQVAGSASQHEGEGSRVVIYLDRLRDVVKVVRALERTAPRRVATLTGTMRGHERDRLITDPVFRRFLDRVDTGRDCVYLVCTSAGEVGIDLYSDHMVSDLVSVERMIQRFGRVNRAGDGAAFIDIVVREQLEPTRHSGSRGLDHARQTLLGAREEAVLKTEAYLRSLPGVSPSELERTPPPPDAYSPPPPYPPLRPWLIDAWSLTSEPHPDLPVDAWLRGTDAEPPDVYFAWREEVETLANPVLLEVEDVRTILQEYRLLPREILRSGRVAAETTLLALAKTERIASTGILVLSPSGEVEYRGPLSGILTDDCRAIGVRLAFRTFLLPTNMGGLDPRGMLDPKVKDMATDVSACGRGRAADESEPGPENVAGGADVPERKRDRGELAETEEGWEFHPIGGGNTLRGSTRDEVLLQARKVMGLPRLRCFPLNSPTDHGTRHELVYFRAEPEPGNEDASEEMLLEDHLERARERAEALTHKLGLTVDLATRVVDAARLHDLGKSRRVWQEYARNGHPSRLLAKSPRYRGPETLGGYRHELGSLVDMVPGADPLVRHLIATHHGHGRPYFSDRALDREHLLESRRCRDLQIQEFVALQREFGWWGLAYLEALVKAADGMASP
jgi:CRISPR-associated endonuclease/helicase Cas3